MATREKQNTIHRLKDTQRIKIAINTDDVI